MACSFTKPHHLLLLVSLTLAMAAGPVQARGRLVHLHFYMHDITGGPDQTAVMLVKGPGPPNPLMPGGHLGDMTVIDDVLTDGPSTGSRVIGRAQGSYMLAALKEPALMVSMNMVLTGGAYNGSTIAVMGRDDVSAVVRELAVVGGTRVFRKATGHVLWRTSRMESQEHMVLELDVYATVPSAAGNGCVHGHDAD